MDKKFKRPKSKRKLSSPISFRYTEKQLKELGRLAKAADRSVSEILREALDLGMYEISTRLTLSRRRNLEKTEPAHV
jgi:hypothetical protein